MSTLMLHLVRPYSADFQPIRIQVHYVQANSSQLLPGATDFIRNKLMPTVTEEFRRIVRVRRTPGPIRLSRSVTSSNTIVVCSRGTTSYSIDTLNKLQTQARKHLPESKHSEKIGIPSHISSEF